MMLDLVAMDFISSRIRLHRSEEIRSLLIGHALQALGFDSIGSDDDGHHSAVAAVGNEAVWIAAVRVFRLAGRDDHSLAADEAIGPEDLQIGCYGELRELSESDQSNPSNHGDSLTLLRRRAAPGVSPGDEVRIHGRWSRAAFVSRHQSQRPASPPGKHAPLPPMTANTAACGAAPLGG